MRFRDTSICSFLIPPRTSRLVYESDLDYMTKDVFTKYVTLLYRIYNLHWTKRQRNKIKREIYDFSYVIGNSQ